MPRHKAVGAHVVGGQVALHRRIHLGDSLLVAGVHVVIPEAVSAHGRQHLAGQFHPVIAGNGREKDIVGTLPGCQFADALADKAVQGGGVGVETFAQNGHNVAPPLGPFAVRAVKESIACIHVDGTQAFLPEFVKERIRAGKVAIRRGVVAGFPVFQGRYPRPMLHRKDDLFAAEPSQGFVFLFARLGKVFGPEAFHPHLGVVGLYHNTMPAFGVFHRKERRHLHIVGQPGHQGIGLRSGMRCKGNFLHAEVFPLRDGARVQGAQRVFHRHGRGKALQRTSLPIQDIFPGIKGNAGFR